MANLNVAFAKGLFAITLFVDDLDVSVDFYGKTLGLELVFQDDNSALFNCAKTYINLLKVGEAHELINPAAIGSGSRAVYTLPFDDVDAIAKELELAGVKILNGPMERPWGIRTVSFQDPSGHIWEIANH